MYADPSFVWGLVALMFGVTAVGATIDVLARRQKSEEEEAHRVIPRFWVGCLLILSYLALIPGLSLSLFRAEVLITVTGRLQRPLMEREETMFGLVHALAKDGLWLGAGLVTIYAVVVPVLKAVLLVVLGLTWRSDDAATKAWRNRCVALVQVASKWASPDMFAYIILACLLRTLNQPPRVNAEMDMGLGFTFFCLFCVGSTISSLGIRSNPQSVVGQGKEDTSHLGPFGQIVSTLVQKVARFDAGLRRCWHISFLVAVCLLFIGLMSVGLTQPSMTMRLDMGLLYEKNPTFKQMRPMVERLHLVELFENEVSISGCLEQLSRQAMAGHANDGLALVMLAVFAVSMPIANVAALVLAAACDMSGKGFGFISAARARKCARTLGHLSMLDVSVMGSVVVALSLRSLREKGVVIELGRGVLLLLCAELSRYILYHSVMHQGSSSKEQAGGDDQQASPSSGSSSRDAHSVMNLESGLDVSAVVTSVSDEPLAAVAGQTRPATHEGGTNESSGDDVLS